MSCQLHINIRLVATIEVLTPWKLANTANQSLSFLCLLACFWELLYQYTIHWSEIVTGIRTVHSNYPGMSIPHKHSLERVTLITFSAIGNKPTQNQPLGKSDEESHSFMPTHSQTSVPRSVSDTRVTEVRLEPLRSTAAESCFLWLVWPEINWISMFWIGRKRYLLAPFCSLSWSCQLAFSVTHHGCLQWRLCTWWREHVEKKESSTVGVSKAGICWRNRDIDKAQSIIETMGPS